MDFLPPPGRGSAPADAIDLTGKILIAMPGMGDTRFEKSVVFLCAHSDEGAMGLIVNKPAPEVDFADLLEQLEIDGAGARPSDRVHFGGPVETGRGFVLHSGDFSSDNTTLEVDAVFRMTATLDILEEIGAGHGPAQRLLCLGYAGWGPGQLEAEFAGNGWLMAEASLELVFDVAADRKWEAALETLGVAALALSSEGGSA